MAAYEALRKRTAEIGRRRAHGLVVRDGLRRLDVDAGAARLGDKLVAVPEPPAVEGKPPVERRRHAKRDLGRIADEIRDHAAGIASVPRVTRPPEAFGDHNLHGGRLGFRL